MPLFAISPFKMPGEDHFKLFYFPVRNLGEPIRMLFNYAGQPFEDVRVPFDEWHDKWKDEMPNGRLPVLEVNGKRLSESHAIMRFLGRKFGLAGRTALEQLRSDEVADLHRDFASDIKPFFYTASGFRDGASKDELLQSNLLPAVGRYFPQLQRALEQNASLVSLCNPAQFGGPFLGGLTPTFADFLVADNLHSLKALTGGTVLDKFPLLAQFVDRVYGLPKLKKYIDQRAHSVI